MREREREDTFSTINCNNRDTCSITVKTHHRSHSSTYQSVTHKPLSSYPLPSPYYPLPLLHLNVTYGEKKQVR